MRALMVWIGVVLGSRAIVLTLAIALVLGIQYALDRAFG